jgi:hypothetical protein
MSTMTFRSLIQLAAQRLIQLGYILAAVNLTTGCSGTKPAASQVSHDLAAGMTRGVADEAVTLVCNTPTTRAIRSDGVDATHLSASQRTPVFIQEHVDPALLDMVHSAMDEALRDASGQEAQNDAAAMADAMAEGGMRGMSRGSPLLAQAIRKQLGPAIGATIREQFELTFSESMQQKILLIFHRLLEQEVIPSVRRMWDQGATDTLLIPTRPDLSAAIIQTSHNLALGTSFGTHDALVDLGVLSSTGYFTGATRVAVWGVSIVVVLMGLASAAMITVLFMIALALWRRSRLECSENGAADVHRSDYLDADGPQGGRT